MSRSIQEELLGVLWFILAAILWQYNGPRNVFFYLAIIKGGECTLGSIAFAIKEAIKKRIDKDKQKAKGKTA